MRITPDTRQLASTSTAAVSTTNNGKKSRKRTFSGQEPMDETDAVKTEVGLVEAKMDSVIKSWILDTADLVTVGEVYTICGGTDARLPLTYGWERRSKLESESHDPSSNPFTFRTHSLLLILLALRNGHCLLSRLRCRVPAPRSRQCRQEFADQRAGWWRTGQFARFKEDATSNHSVASVRCEFSLRL